MGRPRRSALAVLAVVIPLAAATAAQQRIVALPGAPPGATPPAASGDGLVLGRVLDATTNSPVAGALVTLGGSTPPSAAQSNIMVAIGLEQPGQPMALTDADGRFLFRDLAEGRFSLMVNAPGYLPGAHGSRRPEGAPGTVTLGRAEARTDIEIPVWKAGSISGVVLDERGEPVVEVAVRLLRRTMLRGRPGFIAMGGSRTDDRGMYRVGNLAPGDYVAFVPSTITAMPASVADAYLSAAETGDTTRQAAIGVTDTSAAGGITVGNQRLRADSGRMPVPLPGSDDRFAVYPTVFHPSAQTPQQAMVVSLGSGEERAGVDIRTMPVPSYTISGLAVGPAGPLPNATVRLVPSFTTELSSDGGLWSVTTSTDGQGRFTIVGAAPGSYALRIQQGGATRMMSIIRAGDGSVRVESRTGVLDAPPSVLSGEVRVSVRDADLDGIVVSAIGGASVSGRIEFVGRATSHSTLDFLRTAITLTRADGQTPGPNMPARPSADGTFTTREHALGPYTLTVAEPLPAWHLRSVRINGREMIDRPFDLTSNITDVVVTFADKTGELLGSVRPSGGPGNNVGGSVVLFPADYREWIASGMMPRRARQVDVGATGGFEVHGVVPGEYLAAALTSDSSFDLQDPADIEALARVATPVSVSDTQRPGLTLVQTRLR